MIYHTAFFKLQPSVTSAGLEELIRTTRSQLLKIPETLSVRSGKNVDDEGEWPFFYSVEVETMAKLRIFLQDANYRKFIDTIVAPQTSAKFELDYELDPSRDTKYS